MPESPDRRDVARQLLEFYYRQILVEGFFHADPHPGNMLWWDGRVYFLDFGMVGELTPEMRGHLLLLLLAFWQEDVSFLTEVVLIMAGPEAEHADAAGLEADLGELLRRYRHASLGEIQLGPLLQEIAQSATSHGVRLPATLVLTGKALAQMQLTATELDPELDPFSVVGRFLMRNLLSRAQAGVEPKRLFYDVSKLKVRAERLIESFERISGARPGRRLQVDVRGISPLERTIRVAARRVALAVTAGSALVATGTTAAATHLANWVPITLGSIGGAFTGLLLLDFLRGGR
jgi:predicted unusual protein kinase regulating ubiquinone biosynthesis (AarF/ABC1/UbiB family)